MRLDHILSGKHAPLIASEAERIKRLPAEKAVERVSELQSRKRQWRNRKVLAAHKERAARDPAYRMRCNLGSRLSEAVRVKGAWKVFGTIRLTGCTLTQLRAHLESLFTEGMTWKNYGEWHIDHIRPCASFDLLDPEEQRKCFHYTNLRPLWATDNQKKGSRYSGSP